jgi:hypothetical protein
VLQHLFWLRRTIQFETHGYWRERLTQSKSGRTGIVRVGWIGWIKSERDKISARWPQIEPNVMKS